MQKVILLLFSLLSMSTYIESSLITKTFDASIGYSLSMESPTLIINDIASCEGGTATLQALVVDGTPPFTYDWTGPNGFTSSTEAPTINNITAAHFGTYQLTIEDAVGRTATGQSQLSETDNCGEFLLVNGKKLAAKYVLDFELDVPNIQFISEQLVEVTGNVLLNNGNGTDAGFDYSIDLSVTGGPDGSSVISFPSTALTAKSRVHQEATKIGESGGKTALVFAIEGRDGDAPITYMRDPSTKMLFKLKLDSGVNFKNVTYELGDLDYNFISSLEGNTCFGDGEINNYRCRYSYIDRITFLTGIATNNYTFDDASVINQANASQIYSQFTDANNDERPDLANDGRIPSFSPDGNIKVSNPVAVGEEIQFIYDDPGFGIEGDADGYHDFDSKNQVMSFLSGMTFDIDEECANTHHMLCDEETTLTADSTLTDIVWYNTNEVEMGRGLDLVLDSSLVASVDSFYYTGINQFGCTERLCCPIPIVRCCLRVDMGNQDQSIDLNTTPVPLSVNITEVEGDTLLYQWQQTIGGCESHFSNIIGATSATYAPDALSTTTYYRVLFTNMTGNIATCQVYSNCISVIVMSNIGGCVTDVTNRDSLPVAPNTPIEDISVYLYLSPDFTNPIDSTVTDNNGKYKFDSIYANTYVLEFDPPSNYKFPEIVHFQGAPSEISSTGDTTYAGGGIGELASTDGVTSKLFIPTGFSAFNYDVPLTTCIPITLNLTDTTIVLGDTISVTVTGPGQYTWTPNSHIDCDTCARVQLAPTTTTTYKVSSAAECVCEGPEITITVLNEIGGCVNEDINGDGIANDGIAPMEAIAVSLYAEGDTINPIATALTDTNGKYSFDSLAAGKYFVSFVPATDFDFPLTSLPIGNLTYRQGFSDIICVESGEIKTDVDAILGQCPTFEVPFREITIATGGTVCVAIEQSGSYSWTPTDNIDCTSCQKVNLTPDSTTTYYVDRGVTNAYNCGDSDSVRVIVLAELGGCVREDLNRDGVANDGVTPMENIVVQLFAAADSTTAIGTMLTDADGKYKFEELPAGKYFVQFTPATDYDFAPLFVEIGDMLARDGYSDIICLNSGDSQIIYDALLEKCYTTELSITDAQVFSGDTLCVSVSGGGNYEWTPTLSDYENCDTCTVFKIIADSSRTYTVNSNGNNVCPDDEAQLKITAAFIEVSDPCNCLGNKQFGELVTIYSFEEGETWTYVGGTGYYDRNDASTLIPFGTEMTYGGMNADGFHLYNLPGIHIDSIGYTVQFSNGTRILEVSNLCYETELCNTSPIASIGGCVREDLDRDALANDGITPMENIVVNLYEEGDTINPVASMLTGSDGKYLFEDLVAGKYFVEFEEATDYIFPLTALPVGNLTDKAGFTDVICLEIGEDKLDVDALLGQCHELTLTLEETTIAFGESVQVAVQEAGQFNWMPAEGVDCTTCQEVTLTPDSTTTYTVKWANQEAYACSPEASITVTVLNEIGGCVREDLNRDGIPNDGNTAMQNIQVQLFAAADSTSAIATMLTDADGKYKFEELPAGKYFVQFTPATDYSFAPLFEEVGDMLARDGYSDIICLGSGDSQLFYDALLEKCYDTELSITEAKVFSGDTVCVSISGGGNYEWTPAIPGYEACDTCTVFKIVADSSRTYTVVSNGDNVCTGDEAQLDITAAFINISDPCNCLGNKQFGELVTIYSFSEGETWTYIDGTGYYDRNDASTLVPFGTTLTYGGVSPDGFHLYNLPGIHIDSIGYTVKFSNGVQTLEVSNLCYETELCRDLPIASIGGCVREDLNRDALANDGTTPMESIVVNLYVEGDTINPVASMLTGSDGKYLFEDLIDGKYFVEFEAATDYLFPLTDLVVGNLTDRTGFTDVICLEIGEDKVDVDALLGQCHDLTLTLEETTIPAGESVQVAVQETGQFIWTPTQGVDCVTCQEVTLTPDSTTTYTVKWANQDAYACSPEASIMVTILSEIGGCVREDLNRDGIPNDGNTAMENIQVQLFAAADSTSAIATMLTDADGKYKFEELPAGKYFVQFTPATDYSFAPLFEEVGDMLARDGYSDIICLGSGDSQLFYDALLEKCYDTELSITEARVFSGQEVVVTVSGGGNYEWTPAIPGYEGCDTCTVFTIIADSSRIYTVTSNAENICVGDEAQLDITTAFINISDPCDCLGNKLFGEIITINSFSAGETWTYLDGTGYYDRNDPTTLIPFGTEMIYRGLGPDGIFHLYDLPGIHIDSIGYTAMFSNGIQQLQISNLCYETELCRDLPIASLGGCVREDMNKDALANDGSTPMENIVVNLYITGDTDNPVASMLTGSDGKYLFEDLVDGKYFVEFEPATDYLFPLTDLPVGNLTDRTGFTDTICLNIGEDKLDVDALLGKCHELTLTLNETAISFGESVNVSVQEAGQYTWMPTQGVDCPTCQAVTLTPDSTTTYTVKWANQDSYACSPEASITVTVLSEIGGCVREDLNRDGLTNDGLTPMENIVVNLYVEGDTVNPVATMLTGSDGKYLFEDLLIGKYFVEFEEATDYLFPLTALPVGNLTNRTGFTDIICLEIGEDKLDIDALLGRCHDFNLSIETVEILAGETVSVTIDQPGDYTWSPNTGIDCTNCQTVNLSPDVTTTYNVTWAKQDSYACLRERQVTVTVLECSIEDLAVSIDNATVQNPTLTASANLATGRNIQYQWQVSTTSCEEGFTDISGATTATYSPNDLTAATFFRVLASESRADNNICVQASACIGLGIISGCLSEDTNRDGIKNSGDRGMGNVAVSLFYCKKSEEALATTTTDKEGNYIFTGLASGDYIVQINAPENFLFPIEGSVNQDGFSDCIPLGAGLTVTDCSTLLGACHDFDLSTLERTILAGEEVCVSIDRAGDYTWSPTANIDCVNCEEVCFNPTETTAYTAAWVNQAIYSCNYAKTGAIEVVHCSLGNLAVDVQQATYPNATFTASADVLTGRNITYQWQVSTTSCDEGFTDITGATSATYTPSAVNAPAFFRVFLTEYAEDLEVCSSYSSCIGLGIISGCISEDVNRDGAKDGLDVGMANVAVSLFYCNQPKDALATTTTDKEGNYIFTGLASEDYVVQINAPDNFLFPNESAVTKDGFSACIPLGAGLTVTDCSTLLGACHDFDLSTLERTILAGEEVCVSIDRAGDYTWSPNINIDCINCEEVCFNPTETTEYTATWTHQDSYNCNYAKTVVIEVVHCSLGNLAVDVQQATYPNATFTASADVLTGRNITYQWQVSTTSCEEGFTDITGATSATYTPSAVNAPAFFRVFLTEYAEDLEVCSSYSSCVELGKITGCVTEDTNRDGIANDGNIPMVNVTVSLYACSDLSNPISSTTTDADGKYCFANLVAGEYTTQVTAPTGYNTQGLTTQPNPRVKFRQSATCIDLVGGTIEEDCALLAPCLPTELSLNTATIVTGEEICVTVSGAGNYTWTPATDVRPGTNPNEFKISPTSSTVYTVQSLGAAGCEAAAQIKINVYEPQSLIKDPCTCLGNGQFSDEIRVLATTPNETWTLATANGLNVPIGTAMTYVGPHYSGLHIYNLLVQHQSGIGYMGAFTNGNESLDVQNICHEDQSCIIKPFGDTDVDATPGAPDLACTHVMNVSELNAALDSIQNCVEGCTFRTDVEGGHGLYADDEARDNIHTICPVDQWHTVKLVFNDFDLATGDQLVVHDGPDVVDAPIIATWSGSGVSQTGGWIAANCDPSVNLSGCLTFRFITNGDNNKGTGWNAIATCEDRGIKLTAAIQNGKLGCDNPADWIEFPKPTLEAICTIENPMISFVLKDQAGNFCGTAETDTITIPLNDFEDADGNPTIIRDLGAGIYVAEYFLTVDPVKTTGPLVFSVSAPALVCNDELNISLNSGCGLELSPDDLLENPCPTIHQGWQTYSISLEFGTGKQARTVTDTSEFLTSGRTASTSTPIVWLSKEEMIAAGLDGCNGVAKATIIRTLYPNGLIPGRADCRANPIVDQCVTTINFQDVTPPVIALNALADTLVTCDTTGLLSLLAPSAIDNCSADVDISFTVQLEETDPCFSSEGSADTTNAIVSITATDNCGNTTILDKTIIVIRPQLEHIFIPTDTAFACELQQDGDSGTPGVQIGYKTATGFTPTDTVYLNTQDYICGYLLQQEDIPVVGNDCGRKKYINWSVLDWCESSNGPQFIGRQFINYIDTLAPAFDVDSLAPIALQFAPWDCTYDINTLAAPTASDNCSTPTVQLADVFRVEDGERWIVTAADWTTLNADSFELRWVAADVCHEQLVNDTLHQIVVIEDVTTPNAVCIDKLNVSIGREQARIHASDIDGGSSDACGITSYEVSLDKENWDKHVTIDCETVHTGVDIHLRVTDQQGNQATCWMTVNPEDKLAPICTELPTYRGSCQESHAGDYGFSTDVDGDKQMEDSEWKDLFAAQLDLYNTIFGDPVCSDNLSCQELNIQQQYQLLVKDCGEFEILRRYRAIDWDGEGNISPWYTQAIVIEYEANWKITLPADWVGACGETIPAAAMQLENGVCDALSYETSEQIFTVAEGACMKVVRTYTITNLCKYDAGQAPVIITRNEEEGQVREGFMVQSTDEVDGVLLADAGVIQYIQVLKLQDNEPPVVATGNVVSCLTECSEERLFSAFGIDCNLASTEALRYSWEIFENGIQQEAGHGSSFAWNVQPRITSNISYRVIWTVIDACGNVTKEEATYDFEDCKQPTAYCLSGIAIPLMPTGMVEVWANDLNVNSFDNCTASDNLRLKIRKAQADTAPTTTTEVVALNDNLVLTCEDLGNLEVELYIIDEAGNWDFCTTYINVQDHNNACQGVVEGGEEEMATVSGIVQDWKGQRVERVLIQTSTAGTAMSSNQTGVEGTYEVNLPMYENYTLQPSKDINPLNGVSTFDLVLISKHILGLQAFENPYQYIAADINQSSTITAFDMVQLRRLILGIDESFSNNTSWRFVDALHEFASNPLAAAFPEMATIVDLHRDMQMNFVAVKIGDVNGNAQPNSFQQASSRTSPDVFEIKVVDRPVKAGETYQVTFTTEQLASVQGYQFTLNYKDLQVKKLVGALMGLENFGLHKMDEGFITASWNKEVIEASKVANTNLFTIKFKAQRDGQLSELLTLQSRPTTAEAYDANGDNMEVRFNFTEVGIAKAFELYQNEPNPFQGQTTIRFYLLGDSEVALTLRDETGKVVKQVSAFKTAGLNQIQVTENELPTGFIYYQLTTAFGTKAKKMIKID